MDRELILRAIAKEQGRTYEDVAADPTFGGSMRAPALSEVSPVAQPDGRFPAPAPAPAPESAPAPAPAPTDAGGPPPVLRTIMPAPAPAPAPAPRRLTDAELLAGAGLDTSSGTGSELDQIKSAGSNLDKVTDAQAAAELRIGAAAEQSANSAAEINAAHAAEVAEVAKKHGDRESAWAEIQDRTYADFQALNEKAAKLSEIRDRRTSSQRAWGGLAVALGTFADGVAASGGWTSSFGKDTQDMIDGAVKRDIQLQQQRYDNARTNAEAKKTEYGMAKDIIADERDAARFAVALRKESFAAQMEAEAMKLKGVTARDRALQAAGAFKSAAEQEKLGVLKSILTSKAAALNSALMLGDKATAARLTGELAGGDEARGVAPSASIVGGATKAQQGTVNVEGMRAASIPGLEITQDPAMYPADVVKAAREYKIKNDQFVTGVGILRNYWARAADTRLPEVERRRALTDYRRYRGDLIAKMSIKNDQGVVTNPEMEQRVRTMPEPSVNLLQQGKQAFDEWINSTYYGADMFDRIVDEQRQEAASTFAAYGYAPASSGAPSARSASAPTPAPQRAKPDMTPKPLSEDDL